jgi:intracellular multiplication protein IcmE
MAGKKENLKALFSNTRSRIIILFTLALLFVTIGIGYVKLHSTAMGPTTGAHVRHAPTGIQSIPGSQKQTAQYAALQESQNVAQATQATQSGSSAIPTIVRTHAFGEGVDIIGFKPGEGGIGFSTLSREDMNGPQKSLWIQSLKESDCNQISINKVVSQGADVSDLREACSCRQLKTYGLKLVDLEPVCTCDELRQAGFGIVEMRDAGFTAGRLRLCGYVACDERGVGFSAQEMKDAGFSDGELKGAGFSERDIARAGGLPDGMTVDDVRKAGCSVEALIKLRAAGVSAAAIRRINGCSTAQLKAAGFSAADLKNAGFSAAELKKAGFSAADLKQAGMSARDLLNAGFGRDELANAGFSPADIKAADAVLPEGITADDVKKAGCSAEAIKRQRLSGVSAAQIRKHAGCSAQALKEGGFNNSDLLTAGFSPSDANVLPVVDDKEIRSAGCDPEALKVLFAKGVSAKRIHELNGCSAEALKKAGFDAASLLNAGFTPEQLLAAGFTPTEINTAQALDDNAIRAAGCGAEKLKDLIAKGVSAKRIRDISGCSAQALKAAGFDAQSLANAGLTPEELLAAGFTPEDLLAAGLSPTAVIAAGRTADCSPSSLKAARAMGVSAATIKRTLGCSAQSMKAAGFSPAELKNAGFTAAELKQAGFGLKDLKDAGFNAKDLRAAGFDAKQLKEAGFGTEQLKDAGFSAGDLKNAGLTPEELKAAGFSAAELKAIGFDPVALKKAGFSVKDLKEAGFDEAQLKAAGFSNEALRNAGFSALVGLETPTTPAAQASSVLTLPSIEGAKGSNQAKKDSANTERLNDIRAQQGKQMAAQRYQQKIQQRTSTMLAAANQSLQGWKVAPLQTYVGGSEQDNKAAEDAAAPNNPMLQGRMTQQGPSTAESKGSTLIRTGDVLFAVIDTSVNTDEPGPILATIVSGQLKGARLIGSFNLPGNADKMIVSFNTLSIPGADKTLSINAYAIDPNTARTALSSQTDHHYLSRYGALFASTFMEGFGNAFQSANTTITIGGTGGTTDTTVTNGVGNSLLENAVIGLATVGKAWGQVAAQNMSRPTTIELFAGTGVGVLFTQDLKTT